MLVSHLQQISHVQFVSQWKLKTKKQGPQIYFEIVGGRGGGGGGYISDSILGGYKTLFLSY